MKIMARRKSNGFSDLLTCLIVVAIIGGIITYWYIIIPAILILVVLIFWGKSKGKTTSTVKKAHSNKPVNEFKRIEK